MNPTAFFGKRRSGLSTLDRIPWHGVPGGPKFQPPRLSLRPEPLTAHPASLMGWPGRCPPWRGSRYRDVTSGRGTIRPLSGRMNASNAVGGPPRPGTAGSHAPTHRISTGCWGCSGWTHVPGGPLSSRPRLDPPPRAWKLSVGGFPIARRAQTSHRGRAGGGSPCIRSSSSDPPSSSQVLLLEGSQQSLSWGWGGHIEVGWGFLGPPCSAGTQRAGPWCRHRPISPSTGRQNLV